jgi:histidinol phosphatase-like PHP family hydrolase
MMSLHNHTNFSDGDWSPGELVEAAVGLRIPTVGINDHLAATHVNSLAPESLDHYIASVRKAAAPFASSVEVFVGAELHASPRRTRFELVDPAALGALDYLVVEYVADEERGGMPFWDFIEFRKKVPCPVGLAHSDLATTMGHVPAKELAELLAMEDIFVELNTNRQYTRLDRHFYRLWPELFREIANAGGKLSVGTDVHQHLADLGNTADAEDFARSVGAEACFDRCLAGIRKRAGERII